LNWWGGAPMAEDGIKQYSALEIDSQEDTPPRPKLKHANAGLTNFWVVDPHTWWRHPALRIFVPIFIMGLDFFVYGEDPVNDSRVEYAFPLLGHWYGLLCLWPSEVPLIVLRIVIIVVCTALGMYFGRQWVHHRLLRDRWRVTMFEGNNGTLLIMVFTIFIFLFFGALAYNFILGGSMEYPISSNTHMEFYKWGKVFQIFSVFLDIISIVMITDAVFQDRTHYPDWAAGFKRIWVDACGGCVRVLAVWLGVPALMATTTFFILSTGHGGGSITWRDAVIFGGLSEVWRTNLLGICVFCDLLAVAQDWEFPSFRTPIDVMIAGTFSEQLSFSWVSKFIGCLCWPIPKCLCSGFSCCCSREDFVDFFHFKMTGPWLAYMPLVLAVIFGDLVCGKNQLTYSPANYGQYVDKHTHRIWNIMDKDYLKKAYTEGVLTSPDLITYEARRDAHGKPLDASAATDILLNSRYNHEPVFVKVGPVTDCELAAFLLAVLWAVLFMILVIGGERVWKSKAVGLVGTVAS